MRAAGRTAQAHWQTLVSWTHAIERRESHKTSPAPTDNNESRNFAAAGGLERLVGLNSGLAVPVPSEWQEWGEVFIEAQRGTLT